jgi:anti-sigma factor RsiW
LTYSLPSPCPEYAPDITEAYVMRHLPATEAGRFERHIRSCAYCSSEVRRTQEYISAMRAAVRRMNPCRLQVRRVAPHKWVGRMRIVLR